MNNNNRYITVSAINKYIKHLFDTNEHLGLIYLKGEISNFKAHSRGHYYFTLKDEHSRINAVMFSYQAGNLKFIPTDGMKVLVTGKISVYEEQGSYQVYVSDMIEEGIGNLYIAFEQLKKKLEAEGLFDRKRSIPKIPKKIGIITAPTGAAIKDILTTIKRRYPIVETILFPSLVQGSEASKDIVKNIELANTYDLDVLIVGRGGGSIEDLWSFNEEIVARAIYNSKIPVISAVGHEIDFTIADFVSDLRAPTPTAAAEIAVPDINKLVSDINNYKLRSYNYINNSIDNKKLILNKLLSSYVMTKPMAIYEIKEQKLDNIIDSINKKIKSIIDNYSVMLYQLKNSYILTNPSMLYKLKEQRFISLVDKLETLNPLNTLKRGYAIVRSNNKVISEVDKIKIDDIINIELKDGIFTSKVTQVGGKNG